MSIVSLCKSNVILIITNYVNSYKNSLKNIIRMVIDVDYLNDSELLKHPYYTIGNVWYIRKDVV